MNFNKFFSLVAIFFLFTCSGSNDDNEEDNNSGGSLTQVWNLTNITGGISGIDENFDRGVIIWTFDSSNLKIRVQNNSTTTNFNGLETGVYNYTIETSIRGGNYIIIDNNEFGEVNDNQSNVLIIDQTKTSGGITADGFILKFDI